MGLLGLLSLLHSAFFRDQVGRGGPAAGIRVRPWAQLRGAGRGDSGPDGGRGRTGLRTPA